MKIGFIEPHLKEGIGGIRRIIEISKRLQKLGHVVQLYTPKGRQANWIKNDIPTYKLSKMHRHQFDVVLFNLAEQYKWALDAKAKKKFFWVLAPEAEYKNPVIPMRALKQGFKLLSNSNFTVSYIKKYLKVNQKIPVIPGGINPNHFRYDPNIKKYYHGLYFGSFRPWKGGSVVEAALSNTALKILKMEGSGTKQKDMYKLYGSATVYISANQCEGFSMCQLEAMACGTAVLTTDDGGSRDYIKHNINAWVVPRTLNGIRKGLKILLNDKDLRRRLRKEGLKTAKEERFDWNNVTKKLEKVFMEN